METENIKQEINNERISIKVICSLMEKYSEVDNKEDVIRIGSTVSEYFLQNGYDDIEFWLKEENIEKLHKYFVLGRKEPIEAINLIHENRTFIQDSKLDQENYDNFQDKWFELELPSYIDKKYNEIKESFKGNISVNKIFDKLEKLSKSEDPISKGASEKFISNLIFDPEFFVLADSLRLRESNKKKNEKIFFNYKETLNKSFENNKCFKWDWFCKEGKNVTSNILKTSPYLYMDILNEYLTRYSEDNISKDSEQDIQRILKSLFGINLHDLGKEIFDKYTDQKKEEDSKDEKLDENIEFFKDTSIWSDFWKDSDKSVVFTKLFYKNEKLFNYIINSLINNSSNQKDKNHFDNIRMINIIGKRLSEQSEKDGTVKDPLGDERDEIERRIITDAKRICSQPELDITLNLPDCNEGNMVVLLGEYFKKYSFFVEKFDDCFEFEINNGGFVIKFDSSSDEFIRAINSLGLEYEVTEEGFVFTNLDYEKAIERIVGILISPTLFEWREDDKKNINSNNKKLRSLFFLPSKINIKYSQGYSDNRFAFSSDQKKMFLQNYLQWYIQAKFLTGDIESFNTVVTTWLSDDPNIKQDVQNQKSDIQKKLSRIWDDFEDSLNVVFDFERFRKIEVLKNFLTATNIEEIVALISNDRYQISLLTSSILTSALKSCQERKVYRGILQTQSTLKNKFEGMTEITSLSEEKIRKIKKVLKDMGFNETEDGLEMFRHWWKNTWYLRGSRGNKQTLTITSSGLQISNPAKSMYEVSKVKKRNGKGEIIDGFERKYGGGPDKEYIPWHLLRQISDVELDYIPSKDIAIGILTSFASIAAKKLKPEKVKEIEKNGPANIILKLPGRDEPLCEIFAIEKPREFWNLLKKMSELMADEEGAETVLDLLKLLEKN